MTNGAVLCLFLVLGIVSKGLPDVIQTQQTVMAEVGDKVSLSCQLMETKDVFQVTWQKILPDRETKVVSYNKYFGHRVNPGFRDKVEFENSGLKSSSILIINVTQQDEGCYLCLFNSYPEGALTGRTCLQVYELHQPVLHVRGSNSTGEVVVSCSATGRPAPTVTLRATQAERNLTQYDSVSVSNTNGTVTVTTTAVLSALHLNSTQVGCRVGVLSGPQIEVLETIPGLKPTSADDSDNEVHVHVVSRRHVCGIVLVMLLLIIGLVAAVIVVKSRRQTHTSRSHKEPQRDEVPETTSKDTQKNEEDNEWTPEKTPDNHEPDAAPSAMRRLIFDEDCGVGAETVKAEQKCIKS